MQITAPIKVNANAVITNSEQKILLIKLKGGPFAGGLCIPGGGVHPGELSEDAAKREILEETEINITSPLRAFGFCELMSEEINQHKIVMLFSGSGEGIPQETEEGIGKWYSYEEAQAELIPFAREALRIWKENQRHFILLGNATGVKPVSNL